MHKFSSDKDDSSTINNYKYIILNYRFYSCLKINRDNSSYIFIIPPGLNCNYKLDKYLHCKFFDRE